MTERVIAPERLTGIDWVFSSHNHTDHLDGETLIPLRRTNRAAMLVFPAANREFIANRLGEAMEPALAMNETDLEEADGGQWQSGGVVLQDFSTDGRGGPLRIHEPLRIHWLPAAHNEIERDAQGQCRFLGYVVELGPWRIYHSGDTLLYAGMVERLRAVGQIDLALLPINGNRPERRVAGNLDGREAAQLAHEIGARLVVPCHYEMFEFNTADPRELFVPECERLGQAYRVLRAGESLTMSGASGGPSGAQSRL
jgi:L-ascorbate metabolism protein UlaG (beta-lactamase superfamily)